MARNAHRAARRVALGSLACLAASCAARQGTAPPPGPDPASPPASIRIAYEVPRQAAHARVEAELRQRRVLEHFQEMYASLPLPRTLTLRFAGCDGESNAWYEPRDATVTFCYEYVAELRQAAAKVPRRNVTPEEAGEGLVTFVMFHEIGHALFDLLDVPILGREEDAADSYAVVMLLELEHESALRTLWSVAWVYRQEAEPGTLGPDDLADAHGLYAQRYYNILCMAYGGDPKRFAPFTKAAKLPPERADGCAQEYHKARSAVARFIDPTLSPGPRVARGAAVAR